MRNEESVTIVQIDPLPSGVLDRLILLGKIPTHPHFWSPQNEQN